MDRQHLDFVWTDLGNAMIMLEMLRQASAKNITALLNNKLYEYENYKGQYYLKDWMLNPNNKSLYEKDMNEGLRQFQIEEQRLLKEDKLKLLNEAHNFLIENANTLIKDFSKPQTPQLNALDVTWAVYLFGNDYDAKLNDITNLLEILVDNRIN